jgi:hypothetical protein
MVSSSSSPLFIFCRAKSAAGFSISDKYDARWQTYHLSVLFKPTDDEAWTTRASCSMLCYVNPTVDFAIITPDEIDKLRQARKRNDIFCQKCVKVAMVLRDIPLEEKEQEEK